MGRKVREIEDELESVILTCVPSEGSPRNKNQIWILAHRRGVGSKSTFYEKFRKLSNASYMIEDPKGYYRQDLTRTIPYARTLNASRPTPSYIKLSTGHVLEHIRKSYFELLAQLVNIDDRRTATDLIDLFLKVKVDRILRGEAEKFWGLRKNPAVRRVAQTAFPATRNPASPRSPASSM